MNIIYVHLMLMSIVFVISLIAGFIAKYLKKKKWWLKFHKTANRIKIIFALIGFIMAIILVNSIGLRHFSTLHGIIGLIVFLLIILQSFAGIIITSNVFNKFKIFKEKNGLKIIRMIHRKSGIIIIFLIFINLLLGLTKVFF